MLLFLSVGIMAIVGYCYIREGVFTAFVMMVNVLVAGLLAFNFWEPLADVLDPAFADSFLHGYEDAFCLVAIFCLVLGGLRLATNNLAVSELTFPMPVLRGGGVFFGLATGYLVAGFLVCVMQTLPWYVDFMGFKGKVDPDQPGNALRRVLPPDRVWLAMMHREGMGSFGRDTEPGRPSTFDPNGSFELRYERYRRYTDSREAMSYDGLCPAVPGGRYGQAGGGGPPAGVPAPSGSGLPGSDGGSQSPGIGLPGARGGAGTPGPGPLNPRPPGTGR